MSEAFLAFHDFGAPVLAASLLVQFVGMWVRRLGRRRYEALLASYGIHGGA